MGNRQVIDSIQPLTVGNALRCMHARAIVTPIGKLEFCSCAARMCCRDCITCIYGGWITFAPRQSQIFPGRRRWRLKVAGIGVAPLAAVRSEERRVGEGGRWG